MAIFAQTILDKIEVSDDGVLHLRFAKQVLSDGVVISSGWHRTAITPGDGWGAAQVSFLNSSLGALGFPGISTDDEGRVSAAINAFQPAEVISAYLSKRTSLAG